MAVFDDRLEITSPGGLLPGVTIERMKEEYSKVRNHVISSAFSYMNIIEQWGSGVPRIIQEVSMYGLKETEFYDMECALRICIYRNTNGVNETIEPDCETINIVLDIKEHEQCLQKLIEQAPEKLQKEYAKILGVSVSTGKRIFAKLQSEGLVRRDGTNRRGRWIIERK